jgi:hypothetical protein
VLIAHLGKRYSFPPTNGCAICKVFFDHRVRSPTLELPSSKTPPDIEYQLRVFSYMAFASETRHLKQDGIRFNVKDTPQIAIVPMEPTFYYFPLHFEEKGAILVTQEEELANVAFHPQAVQGPIDFSKVREWMSHCELHHQDRCRFSVEPVLRMKVIDCSSSSAAIIPAPKQCSYAALSYVWGYSGSQNRTVPATIKDAIIVCKELRIPYLWVDRHCINQSNPEEVQDQVNQMDLIYRNASLTIIAATGSGAEDGLPGVGTTPRRPQPVVRMGNVHLLSIRPPGISVRSSRWYTRGWTYQEALLSRRRLYFTEYQVFFECQTMDFKESVGIDLTFALELFKSHVLKSDILFFGSHTWQTQPIPASEIVPTVTSTISGFTERSLSQDLDSFRAFAGIWNQLRKRVPILEHVWGLPILKRQLKSSESAFAHFIGMLMWKHRGLGPNTVRRRHMFPSWTWVGWEGHVSELPYQSHKGLLVSLQLQYQCGSVETPFDNSSGSWTDAHWDTSKHPFPVAILLAGHTISPAILTFRDDNHAEFLGRRVSLDSSCARNIDFDVDRFRTGSLEFLILTRTTDSVHGLLLENTPKSSIRIGTWTWWCRDASGALEGWDVAMQNLPASWIKKGWVMERTVKLV